MKVLSNKTYFAGAALMWLRLFKVVYRMGLKRFFPFRKEPDIVVFMASRYLKMDTPHEDIDHLVELAKEEWRLRKRHRNLKRTTTHEQA
jgi:hypothetical protein